MMCCVCLGSKNKNEKQIELLQQKLSALSTEIELKQKLAQSTEIELKQKL